MEKLVSWLVHCRVSLLVIILNLIPFPTWYQFKREWDVILSAVFGNGIGKGKKDADLMGAIFTIFRTVLSILRILHPLP